MVRHLTSAALLVALLTACGGPAGGSGAPAVTAGSSSAAESLPADHPMVEAGEYDLQLSASCGGGEKSSQGRLTLVPIADQDRPLGELGDRVELSGRRLLLWGQTDAQVDELGACLGGAAVGGDPIHPSVLVDVLEWEGEASRPVLLVSANPKSGKPSGRAARGIALWVEVVDRRAISGVWSLWELTGERRGRFAARRSGRDGSVASTLR